MRIDFDQVKLSRFDHSEDVPKYAILYSHCGPSRMIFLAVFTTNNLAQKQYNDVFGRFLDSLKELIGEIRCNLLPDVEEDETETMILAANFICKRWKLILSNGTKANAAISQLDDYPAKNT